MNAEARLVATAKAKGLTLATAESCTGGMVAARITSVAGSSAVFLGGVVSYANAVKRDLLGVPPAVLEGSGAPGAVSDACAGAMAAGVRERLEADVAVSVTGIAGPDGGTPQKPVGLVYFGVAAAAGVRTEKGLFPGDREAVRRQAADRALALLLDAVSEER